MIQCFYLVIAGKILAVNWGGGNYSGPHILVIFSETKKATEKPSSVLESA